MAGMALKWRSWRLPALRKFVAAAEQGQADYQNSLKYQRYVETQTGRSRNETMTMQHLHESFHERMAK